MSRCKHAFTNITFRAESRIQPLLLRQNLTSKYLTSRIISPVVQDPNKEKLRLAGCPVFDQGDVPSPDVQESNEENLQLDMLSMSRSCESCKPAHYSRCTGTPQNPALTFAEVCHLYCCRYYLSSSLQVPNGAAHVKGGGAAVGNDTRARGDLHRECMRANGSANAGGDSIGIADADADADADGLADVKVNGTADAEAKGVADAEGDGAEAEAEA